MAKITLQINKDHPEVTISTGDVITLQEVLEDLIIPALRAEGFMGETIAKYVKADTAHDTTVPLAKDVWPTVTCEPKLGPGDGVMI